MNSDDFSEPSSLLIDANKNQFLSDVIAGYPAASWPHTEHNFSDSIESNKKVSEKYGEKCLIFFKQLFACFALLDPLVMRNIKDLSDFINCELTKLWLLNQNVQEGVHSLVYTKIIRETFNMTDSEVDSIIENNTSLKEKCLFLKELFKFGLNREDDREKVFYGLMAQSMMENVSFASFFASILWCKKQGLYKGITNANEQIMKDERAHIDQTVAYLKMTYSDILNNGFSKRKCKEMLENLIQYECENIDSLLVENFSDSLTKEKLCKQIEWCANDYFKKLFGENLHPKFKNCKSPFKILVSMNNLQTSEPQMQIPPTTYAKVGCTNFVKTDF